MEKNSLIIRILSSFADEIPKDGLCGGHRELRLDALPVGGVEGRRGVNDEAWHVGESDLVLDGVADAEGVHLVGVVAGQLNPETLLGVDVGSCDTSVKHFKVWKN